MPASRNPRIVDVLAELVAELRLTNRISALRLGSSALDPVDEKTARNPVTRRRMRRLNRLRAEIREGLGIENEEVSDG